MVRIRSEESYEISVCPDGRFYIDFVRVYGDVANSESVASGQAESPSAAKAKVLKKVEQHRKQRREAEEAARKVERYSLPG